MALHSGFAHNFEARPIRRKVSWRTHTSLIALTKTKVTHKPMQPLEAIWSLGAHSPKIVLKMLKITYK